MFEDFQGTSAADLFGGVRWTTGCDWIARFYRPIVGCRDRVRFLSQSKLALQVAEEIAIFCSECLTLLQGHTSLVGNVQILDDDLVTGGSDGRVIIFSLSTYATRLRICAHDNSVTTLQVDAHYLVTGGNDGCVKLFDRRTGALVRELTEACEGVWKVLMRRDKCVIMCKRGGKTVVEILGFAPTPEQL